MLALRVDGAVFWRVEGAGFDVAPCPDSRAMRPRWNKGGAVVLSASAGSKCVAHSNAG